VYAAARLRHNQQRPRVAVTCHISDSAIRADPVQGAVLCPVGRGRYRDMPRRVRVLDNPGAAAPVHAGMRTNHEGRPRGVTGMVWYGMVRVVRCGVVWCGVGSLPLILMDRDIRMEGGFLVENKQ
jgi:hypothetical protein